MSKMGSSSVSVAMGDAGEDVEGEEEAATDTVSSSLHPPPSDVYDDDDEEEEEVGSVHISNLWIFFLSYLFNLNLNLHKNCA